MIIVESLLLTCLVFTLVYAGYTDCRQSIIPNKLLLCSSGIAALLDFVYYFFFVQDCFLNFITNLILLIVIAFFFYCYNLWAAGDSKLLFVVGLCIPGRFYTFWDIGAAPSFIILIFIFSFAFIYVVLESIIIGIKNRNLFHVVIQKIDYQEVIVSYLAMVAAVMLINWTLWKIFYAVLARNQVLSTAINFLVVLSLIQLRSRASKKVLLWSAVGSWCGLLFLAARKQYQFGFSGSKAWLLVLALMLLRMLAEQYNYQTIHTSTVKSGRFFHL